MNKPVQYNYSQQWDLGYSHLDATAKIVDRMILATPTSKRRDKLTEANIHLEAAKKALQEAA